MAQGDSEGGGETGYRRTYFKVVGGLGNRNRLNASQGPCDFSGDFFKMRKKHQIQN